MPIGGVICIKVRNVGRTPAEQLNVKRIPRVGAERLIIGCRTCPDRLGSLTVLSSLDPCLDWVREARCASFG
jgi:hypothetical protein